MKLRAWLIGVLMCTGSIRSYSQRETFDVISFVPPHGWERAVGKDVIAFTKYNEARTGYCTISIYDSRPGTDDLQEEFLLE